MKRMIVVLIILLRVTLQAQIRDFPRPWIPVIYTNTTVAYCEIRIDNSTASPEDEVGAFVEEECRGIANVSVQGDISVATLNIQGDIPEIVSFAIWDASEEVICEVEFTVISEPGGDLGYPPDLLPVYGVSNIIPNQIPVWSLPDSISFDEDTLFEIDLNDHIFDPDGDQLTLNCIESGALFTDFTEGVLEITAPEDYSGENIVILSASDDYAIVLDTLIVNVLPVNDAPVVDFPEQFTILQDETLAIDIDNYIYDVDGDELEITSSDAEFIAIEIAIDSIIIIPQEGWSGSEAVTFFVDDGNISSSDELMINVTEVHLPPELNLPGQFEIDEDISESFDLTEYFTINYGVDYEFSVMGNNSIDIQFEQNIMYISAPSNWNGAETVVITLNDDPDRLAVSDTVEIVVNPIDDEPVLVSYLPEENELVYYEETEIDFMVEAYDIDSIINYSWFVDSVQQAEMTENFTHLFSESGSYSVIAELSDGNNSIQQEWAIEIFEGPEWEPVIYTNSTVCYGSVTLDGEQAGEDDLVGAFIDGECRGIGEVSISENMAYTSFVIHGELIETISFLLYSAVNDQIYNIYYTTQSNPGGDIGYPPNLLPLAAFSYDTPEFQEFPRPWIIENYTNTTIAYGSISFNGSPVEENNEVAGFINGECRGIAFTAMNEGQSVFTMNIQGDYPEPVQFNYYDVAQNQIYSVEFLAITSPGGDIGYPPDLLQLEIFANTAPFVNIPQEFTTNEDESLQTDFSQYISDPDGDEITLSLSGNTNINIVIDSLLVTFLGDENWNGTENISYSVEDEEGHIVEGSFTVNILNVNDPPQFNLPYSFTLVEDEPLSMDFSYYVSDIENDPVTLSVNGNINVFIQIEGFNVEFSPEENWFGEEVITFSADDGQDTGTDDILIIVNAQPDVPIVDFPEQYILEENQSLSVNFTEYISDPDGDELDVYCESSEHIQAVIDGDSLIITPDTYWHGSEEITVFADDNTTRLVGSDVIEIIVNNLLQPPELDLPDQFMIYEDSPETFDISGYFTIFEGDEFSFSASGNESTILEFTNSELTIDAEENWFGSETVIITLDDHAQRTTAADTVEIVVVEVNDTPVLTGWEPEDLEFEVIQDSSVTFTVYVDDVEGGIGYSWFVNNIEQPAFDSLFTYTFNETGMFEISCMAFDEEEELYVNWQVSVVQVSVTDSDVVASSRIIGSYPNPFNQNSRMFTNISFTLKDSDFPAELQIFNLKGQMVWKHSQNIVGENHVLWDGRDKNGKSLPSGVYLYLLKSQEVLDWHKQILLK